MLHHTMFHAGVSGVSGVLERGIMDVLLKFFLLMLGKQVF